MRLENQLSCVTTRG